MLPSFRPFLTFRRQNRPTCSSSMAASITSTVMRIKKRDHRYFVSNSHFYMIISFEPSLQESTRLNANARTVRKRLFSYGLWFVVSAAIFWKPCVALVRFSLANDNASHVVLIPLISAGLIYMERRQIFRLVSFDFSWAIAFFTISFVSYISTLRSPASWTQADRLAGYTLALVLFWIAGFVLLFGRAAAKNARFPLLFLLLTIPLPDVLLGQAIYLLQKGSADVAGMIFDLVGVPAVREGFVFHLAHFNIEIAKECSGIRSSVALLIFALVVGHLLLHTLWRQAVLVIVGLLIMVVKNGVRIATLTILGQYVDPGFLYGRLHREGGMVFFLLGLVLLLPVLWLLKRGEKPTEPIETKPPRLPGVDSGTDGFCGQAID
jgi:exosortase